MKLIKINLDLSPFCEDVEFPSLCEGLYSKKHVYTVPISSTSQDERIFFLIKKNSEKFLEDTQLSV